MKREKRWILPVCVLAVLCIAFLYLWVNRDIIGGRSLLGESTTEIALQKRNAYMFDTVC